MILVFASKILYTNPMRLSMLMFLLSVVIGQAQDTSRMDQVIQSYVSDHNFMGSVLVARGHDVIFSKGYGSANLEWNIPNSPTTKFRLGSITKQFTAASILLLEERSKLKIDDPLTKYLPDVPPAWNKITIRHLLTHSSGIPNFTSFPEYSATEPFAVTPEKLVARFRDKPLDFEPGQKFSYSNSGYALLGYLIEKVSAQKYEQFVRDNIFLPLAMTNSGYDSNTAIIPQRASGYAPSPSGPVNAGFVHMTVPFAAGALYSTTEDLLRWEGALFNGKLLAPASLAKMTAPFKGDYALGLMVHTVNGNKVIEHGGGIEGFNTKLAYYPDTKVTVVALANLNGPAVSSISSKLGSLMLGQQVDLPSERKEITVSVDTLSRYVGTYEMAPKIFLYITLEKDHLVSQLSGQGQVPLFAKSETRFFPKIVDAEIEFTPDALTLYQGGRQIKCVRTSSTISLPPARKEVAVAPAILQTYTGTYQLAPNFALVITLEANQLHAQATGQTKVPLFAESDTKFFYKVVDAQIEFQKDTLTLHQGGADITGTRQ